MMIDYIGSINNAALFLLILDLLLLVSIIIVLIKRRKIRKKIKFSILLISLILLYHNYLSHINIGRSAISESIAYVIQERIEDYYEDTRNIPKSIREIDDFDWYGHFAKYDSGILLSPKEYFNFIAVDEDSLFRYLIYSYGNDSDNDSLKIQYKIGDWFYYTPIRNGDLLLLDFFYLEK